MLVYIFFTVLNQPKNVIYLSVPPAPPDTLIGVIPCFQLEALTIDFEAKCVKDIDRVIIVTEHWRLDQDPFKIS